MNSFKSMDTPITILRVSPVSGHGNLRAFAQVRVGDIIIVDCRLIQQPGQVAYLTGPQKEESGRWWPLVKMTPALRERVQAAVLAKWQQQNKE